MDCVLYLYLIFSENPYIMIPEQKAKNTENTRHRNMLGASDGKNQRKRSEDMYIIAGLGNPTREYEKTRHNVGFDTIDILADKLGIQVTERKHRAYCGRGMIGGEKVLLIKPQTFMNNSGESLRDAAEFYQIKPEHIIVIYDDVSLPPGQLRIRTKGSAGGHNGIKSIISHLNSQEFPRIKIGVGAKPERMDLADYVLSRFSKTERDRMEEAFRTAAEAVEVMLSEGADAAMNRYNVKREGIDDGKSFVGTKGI